MNQKAIRERARRQTPEGQGAARAYRQTPKRKARERARTQSAEYKARDRARNQKSERKARATARVARRLGVLGLPSIEVIVRLRQRPCIICGKEMERPSLDHDHATMKFRDVICHHCNTMLGMARDNTATLLRAVDYLNHYSTIPAGRLEGLAGVEPAT